MGWLARRNSIVFEKGLAHIAGPFFMQVHALQTVRIAVQTYPMDPFRFRGLPDAELEHQARHIISTSPLLFTVLERLQALNLPEGAVASGAIYNTIWNHLTGRDPLTGIKDVDLIYFDDNDLSYEAEDAVIKRAEKQFSSLPVPAELRNQARVHLWFEKKFGQPYPRLKSALQSLEFYASRTHAIAAWLDDSAQVAIHAPFGLSDIFALRVTPNPVLQNRKAHEEKAARAKTNWPELSVMPWPEGGNAVPHD